MTTSLPRFQPVSLLISTLALLNESSMILNPNINREAFVKTNDGILRGSVETSRIGRDYAKYLGIPYAQPPVGDLRFEVRKIRIFWLKNVLKMNFLFILATSANKTMGWNKRCHKLWVTLSAVQYCVKSFHWR